MALEAVLKIEADLETDALYIEMLDRPIARSMELSENIVADFTEDGLLVGIDIQRFSQYQTEPTNTLDMIVPLPGFSQRTSE